jgi:hypothetical protein
VVVTRGYVSEIPILVTNVTDLSGVVIGRKKQEKYRLSAGVTEMRFRRLRGYRLTPQNKSTASRDTTTRATGLMPKLLVAQ